MTIAEIARILNAEVLCGHERIDRKIAGICACDLMSDVLAFAQPGAFLMTGLVNPQVIRTAEMAEISGVCFVRQKTPPEETIRLAEEKKVPLLASQLFLYEACGRLYEKGVEGGCSS